MSIYENNKVLLMLCYDKVEEIRDGYYLVSLDNRTGVVDAANNILMELSENICGIVAGKKLFIRKDFNSFLEYDTVNFKPTENRYYNIHKLDENAWLMYREYSLIGLMNSEGEMILPEIYSGIYLARRDSSKVYLKVRLADTIGSRWYKTDIERQLDKEKEAYIVCDKNYNAADCLSAEETCIDGVQIVAVDIHKGISYFDEPKFKYSIRSYGSIKGKKYDKIISRRALSKFNILEVYNNSPSGKPNKGLIDSDGNELVPPGKYTDVTYIGNGISMITNQDGCGTFVNGEEHEKIGSMTNWCIWSKLPIIYTIKDNKIYYIGNNGRLYEQIHEAFPLYKLRTNRDINLMNMYGTWITVGNSYDIIHPNLAGVTRDDWIKI